MNDVFITENFLLRNDRAVELYHRFAKQQPIIDYHCHLPPREIAADRRFENLSQIWLHGDHYKWRAMRTAGVPERYCTGDASDREKFQKWAETVPQTLRNPLYHWTHLELKRPFGHQRPAAQSRHRGGHLGRVQRETRAARVLGPRHHAADERRAGLHDRRSDRYAGTSSGDCGRPVVPVKVLPAFRPDKAMAVESPAAFNAWTDRLAAASGIDVGERFDRFLDALRQRHDWFHSAGCRLSDHGIETFYADEYIPSDISATFRRVRSGKTLEPGQIAEFKSAMLYELAVMDHAKGWVQQFHFGALRNNNSRMVQTLGPDTGFDSIGDFEVARPMARFLDRLDRDGRLAKTILYNLNPADNDVVATMIGNFQDGTTPGKMQFGSGWWFLDQRDGMEKQLNSLSNQGLLSRFVGMLTDSRSFLSYTRHEYFRRILCNLLGAEMEQGLLPDDVELVGAMVADICYGNAARYFGFDGLLTGIDCASRPAIAPMIAGSPR